MNFKSILFCVLVCFVSFLSAQDNTQYDLYLLIGQSNMAGRGKVEAQDTIVHEQVFSLNKNNEWIPAQDPIHFDKKVAGVGLGRTFGIEMAKANPKVKIGLIPCAVGGSPIDAWKPDGYHIQTKTHPWDDTEKRLKIALRSGTIKGILWHQGESDSNPEKCNAYEAKLIDLIQRVRMLCENQNVPFVAGEFGRFKLKDNKKKYPELNPSPAQIIMKSTIAVVKSDKNAAFVKSKGLIHKGDNTHFNAESYRTFGKRYAKEMINLQR